jgi:hypothetical protein
VQLWQGREETEEATKLYSLGCGQQQHVDARSRTQPKIV